MSFQKNYREDIEKSPHRRDMKSEIRRKRELRTRLILINSGLALIVIMAVLVGKLISLNKAGNDILPVVDSSDSQLSEEKKDKENNEKEEKDKKEPAKATSAPEATGSDKWIRKDLDPDKPMVALTFDDGPYTPVTKRILTTLKKYDAKATFFLVANRIPKYPDVVKQAYNQGCQIASHTYEHKFLTTLKKEQITWQIEKADAAIEKVIGCPSTVLRPPGGYVNARVKKTVGVPLICWNVDSEDWKHRNSKKILKSCRSIKDGDIVLMHDLYPSTAKAVATLVPRLLKKGYQLVTVDELLYYKGIKAENGKVYYNGL